MIPLPTRSTRTDTLCPYTTLCRSAGLAAPIALQVDSAAAVSLDLTMFGPERLFADVQSYAEAGNKQSGGAGDRWTADWTAKRLRSEEHTSELQSLMRISYAVFCLKKKTINHTDNTTTNNRET